MSGKGKRVRVVPQPGESAASLVVRAAETMSPYPAAMVGLLAGKAEFLASTMNRGDLADTIAEFAGVTTEEVRGTMILPDEKVPGLVRLQDFLLRQDQIMHSPLRVAPACLRSDTEDGLPPFHRLKWSVRALDNDPDTGHPLSSRCGRCHRNLSWAKVGSFGECHDCGRRIWSESDGAVRMNPAAQFCADLFACDGERRSAFRQRLPKEVREWSEADLLSLLEAVSLLCCVPETQRAKDAAAETVLDGPRAIAELMDRRVASYKVPSSRLSNLAAVARLCCEVDRSRSRRTREFLHRLVGAVR